MNHKKWVLRATVIVAGLVGSLGYASDAKLINVPPGDLGVALEMLAKQSGTELVYRTEQVKGLKTEGVSGNLSAEDALAKLLKGTQLTVKTDSTGAILIKVSKLHAASLSLEPVESPVVKESQSETAVASPTATPYPSQGERKGEDKNTISEIIVTAQKKSERLQDVPVPVSVIDADKLADNGQVLLRDYYSAVPGFSVAPSYESNQYLSIRGISTGANSTPTVGVTVDDVPYMSALFNLVPDIDPGDLDRVEVLRGPQGTLYGADSMGGLLKFVTRDPSTEGYSGRVEAGTSSVRNGAEPGYSLRASGNIPVSDTLAVRLSAFTRQDPGYIDNPGNCQGVACLPIQGVNEAKAYGARLSALWRPSENLSLKISALYQNTRGDGDSEVVVQPGLGDLQQNYIPGAGKYSTTVQVYSAIVNYKIGNSELTSVTGYNVYRNTNSLDYTVSMGPETTQQQFGVMGTLLTTQIALDKVTQEVRLSTPIGQHFDWLIGGFYGHENIPGLQTAAAENLATGQSPGLWYYAPEPTKFEEYAGFTNLTYRVTEKFDVQIGGRESVVKPINPATTYFGPYFSSSTSFPVPSASFSVAETEATMHAFTYSVTPRFKVSPDLMVYARLASGFRPGGPNLAEAVQNGAPPQSKPDTTRNYELGVKGDLFHHMLSLDASLYYVDWHDIQIHLAPPNGPGYDTNGSGAKSEGVELSVESRPLAGLTLGAWIDYDNAVLMQAFPANSTVYGVPGDRIPDTSRVSAHFSLQQDFPLGRDATGFAGAAVSYVGAREGAFAPTPCPCARQGFPAYTKTDLRVGIKYESWTANLYVNNVTDARGLLEGGLNYPFPSTFIYIQPRTVGLSLINKF